MKKKNRTYFYRTDRSKTDRRSKTERCRPSEIRTRSEFEPRLYEYIFEKFFIIR